MSETDFKYLFCSDNKYPVSRNDFVMHIALPKKLPIKKIIDQNELIPNIDFSTDQSGEEIYHFTITAFKKCIINYKVKCIKPFLEAEELHWNNTINNLNNTINNLNNTIVELQKDTHQNTTDIVEEERKDIVEEERRDIVEEERKDIVEEERKDIVEEERRDNIAEEEKVENKSTELIIDIQNKINSIMVQLNSLINIEQQLNNILLSSKINTKLDTKLDNLLSINKEHLKKYNFINIT